MKSILLLTAIYFSLFNQAQAKEQEKKENYKFNDGVPPIHFLTGSSSLGIDYAQNDHWLVVGGLSYYFPGTMVYEAKLRPNVKKVFTYDFSLPSLTVFSSYKRDAILQVGAMAGYAWNLSGTKVHVVYGVSKYSNSSTGSLGDSEFRANFSKGWQQNQTIEEFGFGISGGW